MNTAFYKFAAIVLFAALPATLFPQNTNKEYRVKQFSFTIPVRGVKVYEISVPKGVKQVRAVLSDQTEMITMELYGPTNELVRRNTTWSNLSNWKKSLHCSSSVADNGRQGPGIWRVKIIGAVHNSKLNKVRSVSGNLAIYFTGGHQEQNATVVSSGFPIITETSFKIPARGTKIYEIKVPQEAKKISAILSDQTEMITMELYGPTNELVRRNTTWSNSSNWRKPLHCSSSIANNHRQAPGIWRVKIIGAVYISKVDKVRSIRGKLKVVVSDH